VCGKTTNVRYTQRYKMKNMFARKENKRGNKRQTGRYNINIRSLNWFYAVQRWEKNVSSIIILHQTNTNTQKSSIRSLVKHKRYSDQFKQINQILLCTSQNIGNQIFTSQRKFAESPCDKTNENDKKIRLPQELLNGGYTYLSRVVIIHFYLSNH
jgi:ankyrin repeat protein